MSAAADTDTPLIYRSVLLYEAVMRCLHFGGYEERYRAVAEAVPEGASVVELCAGHGRLYARHLKRKGVCYLGLDASEAFVRHANRKGVPLQRHDALVDAIPRAEVVILQASLYQFGGHAPDLIRRMIRAASERVIIAEPVRNLSTSAAPVLARLARRFTRTTSMQAQEEQGSPARFDEASLSRLFAAFPEWESSRLERGGREMIGLFRGGGG